MFDWLGIEIEQDHLFGFFASHDDNEDSKISEEEFSKAIQAQTERAFSIANFQTSPVQKPIMRRMVSDLREENQNDLKQKVLARYGKEDMGWEDFVQEKQAILTLKKKAADTEWRRKEAEENEKVKLAEEHFFEEQMAELEKQMGDNPTLEDGMVTYDFQRSRLSLHCTCDGTPVDFVPDNP